MKHAISALSVALFLTACAAPHTLGYGPEPTTTRYTDPAQSGLFGVRPYPESGDVCMVIGENDLTAEFLDHTETLVGCPKHETGAIGDRIAEGGRIVGQAKHWTLISVPDGI